MEQGVSIIIPVYNVERYLPGCIESILNQTHKALEIILIDDGSTDCSGEICNAYALKDSRITVIHKENGGQSDARNNGLLYAKQPYLFFLDSDDYIAPRTIETLVGYAENEKADIVSCQFVMTDQTYFCVTEALNKQDDMAYEKAVLYKEEAISEFFVSINEIFTGKVSWNNTRIKSNVCDKLFRTEIFKEINFPKGKICEDLWIICDLLKSAEKIVITDYPGYFYYQRSGSTMHSIKYDISINDIEAYTRFYEREEKKNNKKEISLILLRLCCQKYRNIMKCGVDKEKIAYIRKTIRFHWRYVVGNISYKEMSICLMIAYCPWVYNFKFL